MLMLVSAVAMLISPCAANPVRNLTLSNSLNSIIDLVEQYSENLTKVGAHLISTTVFWTPNTHRAFCCCC